MDSCETEKGNCVDEEGIGSCVLDQLFDTYELEKNDKHIFILSSAGKPVYSRYGSEDKLVTLFGVMQALVSFVQDSDDNIEAIHAGRCSIVFLIKGHIILVSVSNKSENVELLAKQLLYVYNQVVSVLTLTQVTRIYEQRHNYDLRRLLTGSERLIDHLVDFTETHPEFMLDSITCLPLAPETREFISNTIISTCSKIKNVVFAVLIADCRLITLVRMKKYNLKASDLHLIFNMVSATASFKTAESWTPICLPNFDSSGFLHAHVSYLTDDCQACLLLLTNDRDLFFSLSEAKEKIVDKLRRNHCLEAINESLKTPSVKMEDVGIEFMHHFLYKCKKTSQLIVPEMPAPYHTSRGARELSLLYGSLHSALHKKGSLLKVLFQQLPTEVMFGWVTEKYELYVTFEPLITHSDSINAAKLLGEWIRKHKDKMFIHSIPTF